MAKGRNTSVIRIRVPDRLLELIKERAAQKGLGYTVLARHYLQEKSGLAKT